MLLHKNEVIKMVLLHKNEVFCDWFFADWSMPQ